MVVTAIWRMVTASEEMVRKVKAKVKLGALNFIAVVVEMRARETWD
jgi:hypothetical protein